jgi:hypothetical protein
MRRKNEQQKFGSGHKVCGAEYRKFPRVFDFLGSDPVNHPAVPRVGGRSADSTGTKFGLKGSRPRHRSLRDWWWGDPADGELSLYDKDGLTLARLVLGSNGFYHLRSPITWPHMAWPDLAEAKHHAESFALGSLPLDPKLAARIKRDNTTPHPMGPPPNRPVVHRATDGSKFTYKRRGPWSDDLEIPDFLRRRA